MPISLGQLGQLKQKIEERFFDFVLKKPRNYSEEQHHKDRLSRALGAFYLAKVTGLSYREAAGFIVDSDNDNGIDVVYFCEESKIVYLIQTKLGDAPDQGDNAKFIRGIELIFNDRYDQFTDWPEDLKITIERAMSEHGTKVLAIICYLGQDIGNHAKADFEAFETRLQDIPDRFAWDFYNSEKIYEFLRDELAINEPNISLTLYEVGIYRDSRTLYGQISAKEIALTYQITGNNLFNKNVRYYLGNPSINSGITRTTKLEPAKLFFYNNGLTAICRKIKHPANFKRSKQKINFDGFSIVNGAQTVGSIHSILAQGVEISDEARLFITIIEVGEDDLIGIDITKFRNTQNAVNSIAFAALDSTQEKIRRELALSGINYHYRPYDRKNNDQEININIEEAVQALSAFQSDLDLVLKLKREPGKLYDFFGSDYRKVFPTTISGIEVGRKVLIFRKCSNLFNGWEWEDGGTRRRTFFRHIRYLCFHLFHIKNNRYIATPQLPNLDNDHGEISRLLNEIAELTFTIGNDRFGEWTGFLAISRSSHYLQELKGNVLADPRFTAIQPIQVT